MVLLFRSAGDQIIKHCSLMINIDRELILKISLASISRMLIENKNYFYQQNLTIWSYQYYKEP